MGSLFCRNNNLLVGTYKGRKILVRATEMTRKRVAIYVSGDALQGRLLQFHGLQVERIHIDVVVAVIAVQDVDRNGPA